MSTAQAKGRVTTLANDSGSPQTPSTLWGIWFNKPDGGNWINATSSHGGIVFFPNREDAEAEAEQLSDPSREVSVIKVNVALDSEL